MNLNGIQTSHSPGKIHADATPVADTAPVQIAADRKTMPAKRLAQAWTETAVPVRCKGSAGVDGPS
jgi:hypothetical protein